MTKTLNQFEKDIQEVIDYGNKCTTWSGQVSSEQTAIRMQVRLDTYNNNSLDCFDKIRQLFTESSYNLGKYRVESGKEIYDYEVAEKMSFRFTLKLINSILKFDVKVKFENHIVYSRSTDEYDAYLTVEKFRMELKILKNGKMFLHRACGDAIYVNEPHYSTEISEMIRKSSDLGILYFGNGGRSDVVEYHYEMKEENFRDVYQKFQNLIIQKGLIRRSGSRSYGSWTFNSKNKVMVLRSTTINVTLQELHEVAILFNDFLKNEGYTNKYEPYKWI